MIEKNTIQKSSEKNLDILLYQALSKMYVLIGVRDMQRKWYENIYCANDLFDLPEKCSFEEFRKQIDRALFPKDRAKYFKTIRNCDEEEKTFVEFRMYDRNHELHNYQGMTYKLQTIEGIKHVFIVRNIDAEKQQEQIEHEEMETQRRLSSMMEAIGGAYFEIIQVDVKTGKYTLMIQHDGEKNIFTGKDYEKQMERKVRQYVHVAEQDTILAALSISNLAQKLFHKDHLEIEYRKKTNESGCYGWIRLTARAIKKDEHGVLEFLIGFLDVTESRIKELSVRARERRLCDVIEVQNDRLQQAVMKADAANDAKSKFLSALSHEMRTPINAIMGLSSLALEQSSNQAFVADSLDKIHVFAENMSNLMNNVLDMKTIESGRMKLQCCTCSIRRMVDRICNMIKVSCKEKEHHLNIDCSSIQHDLVEMDEVRMSQILINILTNAVQFTEAGGTISLSVKEIPSILTQSSSKYCFTIEDTGVGIASEQLDHIFDPFVNSENVNGESGSGIGLYIVKNLVSLMDGQIYIKSNSNQGTSVVITLVFPRGNMLCIPEKKRSLVPFPGKRILVVEDQTISLAIVVHLLEAWQVSYQIAQNGKEALSILNHSSVGPFDCVLMDVHLPIMKGDEATKEIRKSLKKEVRNIPIIAMTADAMQEEIQYVISIGMNDHIGKPIFPDALHQCLQKWM